MLRARGVGGIPYEGNYELRDKGVAGYTYTKLIMGEGVKRLLLFCILWTSVLLKCSQQAYVIFFSLMEVTFIIKIYHSECRMKNGWGAKRGVIQGGMRLIWTRPDMV